MFKVIIVTLVICVVVLLLAYIFQDKLLFFPQKFPKNYDFNLSANDKELFIKTADGEIINAIYATLPSNKKVILYFHGNGTSLDDWKYVAADILPKGANLLIIDYRGYGKSSGSFSENGFYNDAEAAYEYLKSNGYSDTQIYFYGRSLGTGVAVEMAVRHIVKGLILESPYTSMINAAKSHYPFLFPGFLLKYKFDSFEKAPRISIPVIIFHGVDDKVIPVEQGRELNDAIKNKNQPVIIESGDHNNLGQFEVYHKSLKNFLDN